MTRVCAVIFDLDNVLYDEKDYIYGAFRRIAHFLSKRCGLQEDVVYEKLVCDFSKKGSMYPRLFNDFVADLGLNQDLIPEIMHLYSSVDAPLAFFSDAESTFRALRAQGVKLALLTNGNVETQRNKVKLLNVEPFFDVVVYARETKAGVEKPHPGVYRELLDRLGLGAGQVICVGDNPHTDFVGARQLGMRTVRLLGGEFRNVRLGGDFEADREVHALSELLDVLSQLSC